MKIRLMGAKLFHADRQTDRHDEGNSRCSQFCESAQNKLDKKRQIKHKRKILRERENKKGER
jgi:hypothetical protein